MTRPGDLAGRLEGVPGAGDWSPLMPRGLNLMLLQRFPRMQLPAVRDGEGLDPHIHYGKRHVSCLNSVGGS